MALDELRVRLELVTLIYLSETSALDIVRWIKFGNYDHMIIFCNLKGLQHLVAPLRKLQKLADRNW